MKITTRVTTTATLVLIMRTMKTMIKTTMTTMMSETMRIYKLVTSCVLSNLVEHAGHGKQDISLLTTVSLFCPWGRVVVFFNGVKPIVGGF